MIPLHSTFFDRFSHPCGFGEDAPEEKPEREYEAEEDERFEKGNEDGQVS